MDDNDARHDTTGMSHDATPNEPSRDVVPVAEAAVALGVTDDAIRARLRRGTLAGEKRGTVWVVDREALIAALQHDATPHDIARPQDTTSRDATEGATRHDATPAVDLAPLADLIDRQGRELVQAREAAAIWQVRALQAEERLAQLTATVEDAGGEADEASGSPESDRGAAQDVQGEGGDIAQRGVWARLRRFWSGG